MQLPENREERKNTGEDFVKKIGMPAAILFLLLSIIATILMFTIDFSPPPEQPDEPATYEQTQ